MSIPVPVGRLARSVVLVACLVSVGASAGLAHDEGSPAPSLSPAVDGSALPSGALAASLVPAAPSAYLPLPDEVAVIPADIPMVSVPPESVAGELVVGAPLEHTLGHCGLWSPIDLDGSLWQPIGGTDGAGGAIDSDEEIGELINATPGTFVLLAPDSAQFTSLTGVVIWFTRAPGELEYPLCM